MDTPSINEVLKKNPPPTSVLHVQFQNTVTQTPPSAMDGHTPYNSNVEDPKIPLLLPIQNTPPAPQGYSCSIKSVFTTKNLSIALGPLACTVICLTVNFDGRPSSRNMLAVLTWVFVWWLTVAVPMPVTSMTPLFLFPLFGLATSDAVAKSYMNDIIALVLGSFTLALAVEHYNIHRRLALNVSCKNAVPFLFLNKNSHTSAHTWSWIIHARYDDPKFPNLDVFPILIHLNIFVQGSRPQGIVYFLLYSFQRVRNLDITLRGILF